MSFSDELKVAVSSSLTSFFMGLPHGSIIQYIACAAPARIRFPPHAPPKQVVDVAQGRVRRAPGAAHLLLVSLPSKPSSSLFSNFTCRSFRGVAAQRCQNRVLVSTASSVCCA